MKPRVSVIIPCFNAEAFIGATLDSVLAQTWPNIEVIVIDDGSSDRSPAVVEGFLASGVQLLRQASNGAAAARNRGFAASNGAFIQFLDADDLIDREKIALQVSRLIAQPKAVAAAEWGRFSGDPDEAVFTAESNWQDLEPLEWLLRSREDGLGMLFPARWLIPRAVAEAAGNWNEALTLGDDGEYFTRVVLAAERVLFCSAARCRYRSGVPASLSGSKNWKSGFAVIDLCEKHILAREDSDRARRCFALSWQHLAHACYPYDRATAEGALDRARALHPAKILPRGGAGFTLISHMIGWRAARRLQVASGRS